MNTHKLKQTLFLILITISTFACSYLPNDNNNHVNIIDMNSNLINDNHDDFEKNQLLLNFNNVIYFDLDKYDISHDFFQKLNNHAVFLKNHPDKKVLIEGHTDERGTPEYNIGLGERRANAVKIYLYKQGIPINQISTISYGKEKLAALGHNEYIHAKNRRAIINY